MRFSVKYGGGNALLCSDFRCLWTQSVRPRAANWSEVLEASTPSELQESFLSDSWILGLFERELTRNGAMKGICENDSPLPSVVVLFIFGALPAAGRSLAFLLCTVIRKQRKARELGRRLKEHNGYRGHPAKAVIGTRSRLRVSLQAKRPPHLLRSYRAQWTCSEGCLSYQRNY